MNPEEIQAQIDAGINSGMAALNLANDLKITTLMFGLAIVVLIALVLALVVVLVVVVLWGRNQKAANDTSRQAVNTATDLRIEASALRASQSSVLENDAVRSKAMSVLAQGVDLVAVAMERITAAVGTMGKSMDTVSAGQTTLNAATMTVSQKINETLKNMSQLELGVREFVTGLGEQGYDIWKLAENEVRPTQKTRDDVEEIANRDQTPGDVSGVTAPTTQPEPVTPPAPVHIVVDAPADTPATVIVATDAAANKAAVAAVAAVGAATKIAADAVEVANAEQAPA